MHVISLTLYNDPGSVHDHFFLTEETRSFMQCNVMDAVVGLLIAFHWVGGLISSGCDP